MQRIFDKAIIPIFLFVNLVLNGFLVGPLSVRIYFSLLLLFVISVSGFRPKLNSALLWYVLFVLFYFIALNINGEITEVDFGKYFLGRYLICFIAAFAVQHYITRWEQLNSILFFVVYLGVINGLVSTLQFIGVEQAFQIPFVLTSSEEHKDRFDLYSTLDSSLGVGVPGIFSSIFKNGYFTGLAAAFSLYMLRSARGLRLKTVYILIALFLFFVVYLSQQRLVFYLTAMAYLYYFFKRQRAILIGAFMGLGIVSLGNSMNLFVEGSNLGRIGNYQDEDRLFLYSRAVVFIKGNFLFGGQHAAANFFINSGAVVQSAHNFILNAFIYSGVFGAVSVILVFIKMINTSARMVIFRSNTNNISFHIATGMLIYLLNSFAHNLSLVTGDEIIWILFFMLLKAISFEKQTISKKYENNLSN